MHVHPNSFCYSLGQPGQLLPAYGVIVADDRVSIERPGNLKSIII